MWLQEPLIKEKACLVLLFLLWLSGSVQAQIGSRQLAISRPGLSSFLPAQPGIASTPKCNNRGPNCNFSGCPIYVFIGKGNWLIPGNWQNGQVPPDKLPSCYSIIINPIQNEAAVLPAPVTMMKGSNFIVSTGKTLIVPGYVIIGQ